MAHTQTQTTSTYYGPGRGIRWQDWANAILAIWLFISPWVLAFGRATPTTGAAGTTAAVGGSLGDTASWNAWVLGVIVFLVAVSAIGRRFVLSQEWINLALGIWIFIAPWILGFIGLSDAAWDHWIVGALIVLVSLSVVLMARSVAVPPPPPPPMSPTAPGV